MIAEFPNDFPHKLTLAMSFFVQRVQERDGLDGFTQTHLVGENGIRLFSVIETQPIDALLHGDKWQE